MYLNEVWLLDVNKLMWHKVVCTGEIPGPRYGHSCHLIGSRMFIFGGKGPKDLVYKDVYFLDLIEWVWVPVNSISGGPSARCVSFVDVVSSYHIINIRTLFLVDFIMRRKSLVAKLLCTVAGTVMKCSMISGSSIQIPSYGCNLEQQALVQMPDMVIHSL